MDIQEVSKFHVGNIVNFMKLCKMLFLLQILLYNIGGFSYWYSAGGTLRMFMNFESKA